MCVWRSTERERERSPQSEVRQTHTSGMVHGARDPQIRTDRFPVPAVLCGSVGPSLFLALLLYVRVQCARPVLSSLGSRRYHLSSSRFLSRSALPPGSPVSALLLTPVVAPRARQRAQLRQLARVARRGNKPIYARTRGGRPMCAFRGPPLPPAGSLGRRGADADGAATARVWRTECCSRALQLRVRRYSRG